VPPLLVNGASLFTFGSMTIARGNLSGKARLTKSGKAYLTRAIFTKGKQFVASAVLLKQRGGYQYVVLHLLCQGMEILQKALLLAHDYDTFKPKISKKNEFGHDLLKGADAVSTAYRLRRVSGSLRSEIDALNQHYMANSMRYGSLLDIFIIPDSIPYRLVLRRCAALVRYGSKKIE
jgi:hypothetical protein